MIKKAQHLGSNRPGSLPALGMKIHLVLVERLAGWKRMGVYVVIANYFQWANFAFVDAVVKLNN